MPMLVPDRSGEVGINGGLVEMLTHFATNRGENRSGMRKHFVFLDPGSLIRYLPVTPPRIGPRMTDR